MAVSGLPEPCATHARDIARLALDMMDLGKEVVVDGEPVVSRTFLSTLGKFTNAILYSFRGLP